MSHSIPSIDFLIITALKVERDAILAQLGEYRKLQLEGSPTYYLATIPAYSYEDDYHVAVTMLSHMGNVASSERTIRAIHDLIPDYVLMVGIAGGVKGQVHLGDVVVATQVIYYEQGKQTVDGLEYRPQTYPIDSLLLERAQNYDENTWFDRIPIPRPATRASSTHIHIPRIMFGPIAVGEKVITDSAMVMQFKRLHAKVAAVEMESFGVAVAAATSVDRPRFLAIRGISDYADPKKDDRWHDYAAASAAAFAIGFLRAGPVMPRSARASELSRIEQPALITIRHQSRAPISEKAIATALPPEYEGVEIIELIIDQTDLVAGEHLRDPLVAARRQISLAEQLDTLCKAHHDAMVAYYGIAHIPLLFLAGYTLSDQRSLQFFDFNRLIGRWNQLQGGGPVPELEIENLPTRVRQTASDVVIRISVSYIVGSELIQRIVPRPAASLHLKLPDPILNAVTSEHQIHAYGKTFRTLLDTIARVLPNSQRIHLFYAGPAALAVHLGQQISSSIHPHVVVYNYVARAQPPYSWGLTITRNVDDPDFLVRPTVIEETTL